MLYRIVKLSVLPKYKLQIEFEDGTAGIVDLADDLHGAMFEPLKDEAFFRKASLDEFGVVCWPNGADYAPDAMYDIITGKPPFHHQPEHAAGTAPASKP
jgi:hypothetical protein